jgi:serine/threonine protein kinase
MRNFFNIVVILSVITIAGAVLFVYFIDQEVIVLKDGTIKTVDETWQSGDTIFFEIDNQIDFYDQDEIKTYGKRNLMHFILGIKLTAITKWARLESGLNKFLKKNNLPSNINLGIPLILLALLCILFFLLRMKRSIKEIPNDTADQEHKAVSSASKDQLPTSLDIVRFFLRLFKYQIGAEPDAKAEFVPLMSKTSGPNHIYELRVKHMEDWAKRRMTIGPLGEEAGSKSKCYYVIYDVHMVVKVPARPVTDFERFIESIKKEVAIVNKLIPKECIIPKVSVILGLIHTFPYSADIPAERLEEKYINWVRRFTEFQDYLKINSTFVYFMDLSQYYFLGHILEELHDIKRLIAREIFENAEIIFEPAKFKGRYGVENDAIFELRQIYNQVEADIRNLVDRTGINTNIPIYQFQSWFHTHLAGREVTEDGGGNYPETFIKQLNLLIKKAMQDNAKVIDFYRKTIKNYIYMSSFEQNSAPMAAITINLLDILAWFRQKRVSMRDLKPDNLFVAGDPERYPLFLRSDREFSLGIIDVETAVDFEQSKYTRTKQPLLGGTPFYATPSHFIRNEVLILKYKDLGKILHLQDWHATLVMIYKVITGELLFDQTAKLFGDLRNMMINANKPVNYDSAIFEEASRMFWHSAVIEFQVKLGEKEKTLKAIEVILPETVKYMFGKVLVKERKSLALAIKESVESQNIFEKEQIREQLMNSSYAKTCQFKAELENNAKRSQNSGGLRTEAITFLHRLADLKALFGQHIYMHKLLSNPEARVTVHDILTFMFNVVLNNMYRPQWKPLFGEAVNTCDMPDEETLMEATL